MKASVLVNFYVDDDFKSFYYELQKLKKYQEIFFATADKGTELIVFAHNAKDNEHIKKGLKDSVRWYYTYNAKKNEFKKTDGNTELDKNISAIVCDELLSPAMAKNLSIKNVAQGDYYIVSHYDIQTNFDIINAMIWHFESDNRVGGGKLGAISACTSDKERVSPDQAIEFEANFTGSIFDFVRQIHDNYEGALGVTGAQNHFFVCIPKEVYEDVGGFNEEFAVYGDDTEWSIRAYQKGYVLCVAHDSFVDHIQDDKNEEYIKRKAVLKEEAKVDLAKWRNNDQYDCRYAAVVIGDSDPVFVGKEGDHLAFGVASQLLQAGVEKVVLFDKGIKKEILADIKELGGKEELIDFKKINPDLDPDEERDYSRLIQYVQEAYNPKWIIFVDCAEMFGQELDEEMLDKLYDPPDPAVFAYGLPVMFHYFDTNHYRVDGVWGETWDTRIFRNFSFFNKVYKKDEYRLKAELSPNFPYGSQKPVNLRIECFGYMNEEMLRSRYDWAMENCFSNQVGIYKGDDDNIKKEKERVKKDHFYLLKTNNLLVRPYRHKCTIDGILQSHSKHDDTEEVSIIAAFDTMWGACKYLYLQDHGCTERTLEVAKLWGVTVIPHDPKNKKFYFQKGDPDEGWICDFSAVSNEYKKFCKSPWVFKISADEYLWRNRDVVLAVKYTNFPYNCVYIHMNNLLKTKAKKHHQDRICIFENREEWTYTRRVHETFHKAIQLYGEKLEGYNPYDAIEIMHTGYLKKPEYLRKKFDGVYHRLNKLAYKEDRKDALPAYNLGIEEMSKGNIPRAKQYFREAIKRDPTFPQTHFQMWGFAFEEAERYAQDYIKNTHNPKDDRLIFLQEFIKFGEQFNIETVQHYDSREGEHQLVKIKR